MLRLFPALLTLIAILAAPAASAVIPRPAPELIVTLTDGRKFPLSQFKGKVVALEFLLTGCPHCQQASRTMAKLFTEYQSKGFQAVGAAINDDAARVLGEYIKQNNVNFPIGMVSRDNAYLFLQQSLMVGLQMPQLVFIDRSGTIRAQYGGTSPFFNDEEKNMRASIESLLKEPAPAPAKTKKGTKK